MDTPLVRNSAAAHTASRGNKTRQASTAVVRHDAIDPLAMHLAFRQADDPRSAPSHRHDSRGTASSPSSPPP